MDIRGGWVAFLVAGAATLATAGDVGAKGKPGGGGTCTPASSRVAFSLYTGTGWDLFAANPDGTCRTQLTTGGSAGPVYAWTDDYHLLINGPAPTNARLIHVPDSTNPASVSVVLATSRNFRDVSQHRDSGGVLPVAQQLLLATAADGLNLEVCTADGASCTAVTQYNQTYTPGGTGTDYDVSHAEWLPPSADRSRIRIKYAWFAVDYVAGTAVSWQNGFRVISLSTAGWPAISTAGMTDTLLGGQDGLIGGFPLRDLPLMWFSRDGTRAALRAPNDDGNGIYVLPVTYDETANSVAVDTAAAAKIASSVPERIYHDLSFSPDNTRIGYNASQVLGKGGNQRTVTSIFTIQTNQQSGSVEIDGQTINACCTVWGP